MQNLKRKWKNLLRWLLGEESDEERLEKKLRMLKMEKEIEVLNAKKSSSEQTLENLELEFKIEATKASIRQLQSPQDYDNVPNLHISDSRAT